MFRLNSPKENLQSVLPLEDEAYAYVVKTFKDEEGKIVQTGSGPNLACKEPTLFTCKHMMRCFKDPEDWIGVWVAGYTSIKEFDRNFLGYLMQVKYAFGSYKELLESIALSDRARNHKLSSIYPDGDIHIYKGGDPHDPKSYWEPVISHSRSKTWHQDITASYFGRKPALLVGDRDTACIWTRPMIPAPYKIGRGQRRTTLGELISDTH